MSGLIKKVRYPVLQWIVNCFLPSVYILLVFHFLGPGISIGVVILSVLYSVFGYLIGQYRYTEFEIHSDKVRIVFLASLFLKDRTYYFNEIDTVFFQFRVGHLAEPYLVIYFKNGKQDKIRFTPKQLRKIKFFLVESNLLIVKVRD